MHAFFSIELHPKQAVKVSTVVLVTCFFLSFLLLKITQRVLNSEEAPFSVSQQLERGARHQQVKNEWRNVREKKKLGTHGKNLAQRSELLSQMRLGYKRENPTENKHTKQ